MASTTGAYGRRRLDNIFFPAMALLALAIVINGFGRSYFFAGMVRAPLPSPLVHAHAAILTTWIAVQVLQPVQVAANKVEWHQRLGTFGMLVAVAVPIIAMLAAIGEGRRHPFGIRDLASDFTFAIAAIVDFTILAFLGLRERHRDLSAHKRLMLLATISILGPAIGRLWFVTSPAIYYAVFAILLGLVIAFDRTSLRRIHRATIFGVVLIVVSQGLAEILWRTAAAADLVVWIQNAHR